MPQYTINLIEPYLTRPIAAIFFVIEKDTTADPPVETITLRPAIDSQTYIDAAVEQVRALGFPCVDNMSKVWLPLIAAIFQYHFVQRANQQMDLPYSLIRQQYQDALEYLKNNPNLCANTSDKPANKLSHLIASRRNTGRASGW